MMESKTWRRSWSPIGKSLSASGGLKKPIGYWRRAMLNSARPLLALTIFSGQILWAMPSNSFTNNDFIFSPVVLTVGGSPWLGFQESEGRRVLYALKTWPLMAARVDVLSAHNSNLQAEANALADLAVGLSNQAAAAAEVYRSREAKSTLRAVLVAGGVLAIGILGGFVVAKITP